MFGYTQSELNGHNIKILMPAPYCDEHDEANRIQISLTGANESVTLKVLDNGIGIGQQRPLGPGMELKIMDYRGSLIGATVQVAPGEAEGTLVSCKVSKGDNLQ